MKESKLYSEFQRLGKVLMAPVLLLPVSGILVGLGSALSNANLISLCPLLGTEPMVIFSTLIKAAATLSMVTSRFSLRSASPTVTPRPRRRPPHSRASSAT